MPFSNEFARTGYTVVRSVLADNERDFLWKYVSSRFGGVASSAGDSQVPGTPAAYGDFATEGLLKRMQPVVEDHVGLSLYPTYSYLRFYKNGDRLKKHADRAACEISTTLCLGYRPEKPWAIWLEDLGKSVPVTLLAGDMLIYRGMDLPHWREAYDGDRLAQVFLHYVDKRGPHSEWMFDKRPALGMPPETRS